MPARTLALIGWFLFTPALGAQSHPPLAFLGFEAGAPLDSIVARARALGGHQVRCMDSRRDPSLRECRAKIFAPGSGVPLDLWLSAMDGASGILSLSGPVTLHQLDGWKLELEVAYGVVDGRVQGGQWMLQWVRQSRMLRLTWRIEGGKTVASVSLVDGQVLDTWGRRWEASHAAPHPPPPTEGGEGAGGRP